MATDRKIKIFIASSGEMKVERDRCILIIFSLNKAFSDLVLEPVLWEYDIPRSTHPGYKNLQSHINVNLQECDVAVFMFHSKIGTFTKEEFHSVVETQTQSFFFFKAPASEAIRQNLEYKNLQTFRQTLENVAAPIDYKTLKDFEYEFYKNLNLLLAKKYSNRESFLMDIKELQETLRVQEQALSQLQKQLENKEITSQLRELALQELNKGNYISAEMHLKESASEQIQQTATTFFELGQLKEIQLQYQQAYDYFEMCLKMQPGNSTFFKKAGIIALLYLDMYDKAGVYFEKALSLETEKGDLEKIPDSLHNLACFNEKMGLYRVALTYSHQAIDFLKTNSISESSSIVNYYSMLGQLSLNLNEIDEALKYFKVGLNKAQRFLEDKPSNLALIENGLGNAFQIRGMHEQALEHYFASMEATKNAYGKKSTNFVVQNLNIANTYLSLDNPYSAIEHLKIALQIANDIFLKEHQYHISIYRVLGQAYASLKKLDEAIEYLERAHSIMMNLNLEKNRKSDATFCELARVCNLKGFHEKAVDCYKKVLEISKIYEDKHLEVETLYQIGQSLLEGNRCSEALEWFQAALSKWLVDVEKDVLAVVLCYEKIGFCQLNIGNIDQAIETLSQSIKQRNGHRYNDDHCSYYFLALAYMSKKEYSKALQNFDQALEMCRKSKGEQSFELSQYYFDLGQCHDQTKHYFLAIANYEKAVMIRKHFEETENGDIGVYYNNIGRVWFYLKDRKKSIYYLNLALPILKKYFPPGHSNIEHCESNLAAALE